MRFAPPDSQVRLATPGPGPRLVADTGIAGGLDILGRQLGQAADTARQQAEQQEQRNAQVEAARILSETRIELHQSLLDAQNQAPADGAGFVAGIQADLGTRLKARIAAAPERARPLLETRFADLQADTLEKAQTFAAGLNLARQTENLQAIVNLNANHVRSNPDALVSSIGLVQEAITNSSLAPVAKEKSIKTYSEAIAKAAMQGLNEQDPALAAAWLQEGRLDVYLSPEAKSALVNDNQVETRRREAEARQAEQQRKQEERQRLMDLRADLVDRMRDEEAASAEGRSTGLKLADIREAYPDQPQVVERHAKKIAVNLATAAARVELLNAPLDQEAGILARFDPAANANAGNYANTAAARDQLLNLREKKHRDIAQDPAAYAVSISAPLEARRQQALTSGQAADLAGYMRRLDLAQAALGIAPEKRRVLAKSDAQALAERIAPAPFDGLRSILGSAEDEAQRQQVRQAMAEAKVAPAQLYAADPEIVAHLGLPGARFLFDAISAKEKDLPPDTRKKLDTAINDLWSGQYEFNARQATIAGDGAVMARQALSHDMLRRAAYATGDAAKAYDMVFGVGQLLEGDDHAIRLPKSRAADAPLLVRGMAAARREAGLPKAGQWTNDAAGNIGFYVGGAQLVRFTPQDLIALGRSDQQAALARQNAGWRPVDTTAWPVIVAALDEAFPKPDEPLSIASFSARFNDALRRDALADDRRYAALRDFIAPYIANITNAKTTLTRAEAEAALKAAAEADPRMRGR